MHLSYVSKAAAPRLSLNSAELASELSNFLRLASLSMASRPGRWYAALARCEVAPRIGELQNHVTNRAVEQVALSRAWVLDRLMRHAQVCLGEIPLRLKMRKAHSADVVELETHQPDASAANRAPELLGRELNLLTIISSRQGSNRILSSHLAPPVGMLRWGTVWTGASHYRKTWCSRSPYPVGAPGWKDRVGRAIVCGAFGIGGRFRLRSRRLWV
jgi:hypothetical protein